MKIQKSVLCLSLSLFFSCVALAGTTKLKYGDGKPDGKRSIGGSGQMIKFKAPSNNSEIKAIKIHGSRYGHDEAPDEDFLIYFLNGDAGEIIHTETAPYKLFDKGDEEWVKVRLKDPIQVPSEFWIVLDFRAHQTKGVYVSYDTSTNGKNSKTGLPGKPIKEMKYGGDWMIEIELNK
jgi:hypothetical protein